MNPVIPNYPLTEHHLSTRSNKIGKIINSLNIIAGRGINIDYNTNGATVSVQGDVYDNRMVYRGNYDFNSQYHVNDVVTVPYNTNFNDENGSNVPIGFTSTQNYSNIPVAIGTFVCVKYVPPAYCTVEFVQDNIAHQFTNIPPQYLDGTRYYGLNVYYPVFPPIPLTYTASVQCPLNNNYSIIANDTFWEPIGIPAQPVYGCKNNVQSTWYESSVESGSLYNPSYLPYSG